MKKNLLLALIISILSLKTYAQSTEIRPGSVLPQMTTSQRTALAAINGMLVFDTNTQSYWSRQNGTWVNLAAGGGGSSFWQQGGVGGNEIINNNTGFVTANSANNLNTNTIFGNNGTGISFQKNWPTIGFNSYRDNSNVQKYMGTGYAFVNTVDQNTGAMFWNAMAYGNADGLVGANEKFVMKLSQYGKLEVLENVQIGLNSSATGNYSNAIGQGTTASGGSSTAIGYGATASGAFSTSIGWATKSLGDVSTSMGYQTIASAFASTAIGRFNIDNPNGHFMVGNGTNLNRFTSFIIRKDNNRVGIGVEDPLAPLHVAGYGFVTGGQSSFFYPLSSQYNVGGNIITALNNLPSFSADLSILGDYGIVSRTYVGSALNVIASDSRIKKDFSLSNNAEDLALLKKIEITNYRMKDVATWGNQTFKKVIAQQVEAIYPEAIKMQTAVIPDIYTLAEAVVYDATNKQLSLTMSKDYGLKVADKVELVHPEKGKIQAEVIAVNGNSFTVKDWNYAAEKIFVFGREVSDFRSVDYEALSMLGISAIQALAKENEEIKAKLKKLENLEERIQKLENQTIIVKQSN